MYRELTYGFVRSTVFHIVSKYKNMPKISFSGVELYLRVVYMIPCFGMCKT